MVRAQILLTLKQRERLERLARREGRTLSDVARRALDAGLDALEGCDEQARRRQKEALAELDHIRARARVRERYGVYEGDLVAEAREERERQQEQVWKEHR
jgi:predicted DNA-binding protein